MKTQHACKWIKTVIAFTLGVTVCIVATILDKKDRSSDVYPNDDTLIRLYGEAHGVKEHYEIELILWRDYYNESHRNLFVEIPYYSAEFLNIWMKEESDELLDKLFDEIAETQAGNSYYYEFLQSIKKTCPDTVFYGTDVGHQSETTGKRYLQYLEEHNGLDSDNYRLAEECIKQGKEYYETRTQDNGMSPVRETYMVLNFENAYERCGRGEIMGIYGSYHTDLNAPESMGGRLNAVYGKTISSVNINSIVLSANPYEIGFCITGLLYLMMLFIPNIIWARGRRPDGYEQAEKRENKVLLLFERIGQIASTLSVLVFPSVNPLIKVLPNGIFYRWNVLILLEAFVLMILYECYWTKYFRSSRTMEDMYSSYAGFPLAGASLPVMALLLMGVYSNNLIVIMSAVILGIGHVGIHLSHRRAILKEKIPVAS